MSIYRRDVWRNGVSEGAPFFYGVKILGDIGIFDEYCRLIEYNNDNSV